MVGNGDPEGSGRPFTLEVAGAVVGNGDPVGTDVGREVVGAVVGNGDPVGSAVGRAVVGDADAGAIVLVVVLLVEDRSQRPV